MAISSEPSFSLSFTSSSHLSNGSSSYNLCASTNPEPGVNLDIISLDMLSSNMGQLRIDYGFGNTMGVHRCILAAKSRFFHEPFTKTKGSSQKEVVIPILLVAFPYCQSNRLIDHCVQRVARSDLDSISMEKLPNEVKMDIKSFHLKSQLDKASAMDVDPVWITLDDANVLHYVAASCDPKVVAEVLDLGLADVNFRGARAYTVLHVSAMRYALTFWREKEMRKEDVHSANVEHDGVLDEAAFGKAQYAKIVTQVRIDVFIEDLSPTDNKQVLQENITIKYGTRKTLGREEMESNSYESIEENEIKYMFLRIMESMKHFAPLRNIDEEREWVTFTSNFPDDTKAFYGCLKALNESLIQKSIFLDYEVKVKLIDDEFPILKGM
uniref:BTB domain-containing protein n=1 Tax=Nelumbo nucifera TaxID=4432 RepID=A0A822ZWY2_NELNU|nr:TPA_asm: hypothetical protein HUJ06_017782 [Nelumbo nucifera]